MATETDRKPQTLTEALDYFRPHRLTGDGATIILTAGKMREALAVMEAEFAALRSEAGAAMREPQATGWLVSAGWKEDEPRGPVIEFVVDTEVPSTGTYGDVWNHARYELHRCADQSGRTLPLQPEGGEA